MKWSSCNAVNESPQVLLGFKAHCCLQQPLISRGGNTHCVNLGCAVRPQRVAEDSSSFLPSPMPCSPADSAACPHSPPCSPHPSHTVCCSFCHPPPKLENLPPDVPKAAWSITLATLVTLSVQKSTPKTILPLLSKGDGAEKSTTFTLESLPLLEKEIFTDNPDYQAGWFWATGRRNLSLSVCAHQQDDTTFFCKPCWTARINNNRKRTHNGFSFRKTWRCILKPIDLRNFAENNSYIIKERTIIIRMHQKI